MSKKLNIVFGIFSLIVLFFVSLSCCFNSSNVVYADVSSVDSYSFNGSNIGYVSSGVGNVNQVYSFNALTNLNDTYEAFLFSAGFSTVNKDFGLGYTPAVDLNLNISLINRTFHLFPIRTYTDDYSVTYYIDNICQHCSYDTSVSTDYCTPTLNSTDFSFDYSYSLFGAYDNRINILPNSFVSNQIISYNAIKLSPVKNLNGSYYYNSGLMFSAFRLGDVTSFDYNYQVVDYFRNINVSSVEIGSSASWSYSNLYNVVLVGSQNTYTIDLDVTNDTNLRFNYIIYHFETGASLLFVIGCQYYRSNLTTYTDNFLWDYRTYYLTNDFINTSSYNQGYSSGYNAGYNFGYDSGVNIGLVTGQQYGESIGYARGVSDAGNYTFFSLISAVIDAPITAFTSLFNFEFLGFNLLNFITGLLTLAFVIWIIRLIL